MNGDDLKLRVDVGVEGDADAAELDRVTEQLRRELLELDVQDVDRPSAGSLPPGPKAAEVVLLGTLVVTATQELVSAVVRVVMGWFSRSRARTVKLEIAGDSIEIADPSSEDQRRLLELLIARHAMP